MAIFLMILKIIGIILLSILGLLVFLILVVLFDPIGYKVSGSYDDTYEVNACGHWLCHILSVKFILTKEEKHLYLRIFGISIRDMFAKKEKKTPRKKTKQDKKVIKSDDDLLEATFDDENDDSICMAIEEYMSEKSADVVNDEESLVASDTETGESFNTSHKEMDEFFDASDIENDLLNNGIDELSHSSGDDTNPSFFDKIFSKISQFFHNMKELCDKIIHKFKDIKDKLNDAGQKAVSSKAKADEKIHYIQKWIYVLSLDQTKRCIEAAKEELIKVLRHVLPRKWKMNCEFGFEDPALTGKILGYYWMFTAICMDHVTCVPDFENQVLKAEGYAKGHIQLYVLCIAAYKFFFDKRFKYLRKLKKRVDAMK